MAVCDVYNINLNVPVIVAAVYGSNHGTASAIMSPWHLDSIKQIFLSQ
jgi:hypothetical protein